MFLTYVSDGFTTVGVENMYTHFCILAYIQHTMTHAHVRTHAQGHTNKHTHTRAQDIQTCSERSAPTINVGTLAAAESRKKQQKQQQSHNTCKHQTIKSKVNEHVKTRQTNKTRTEKKTKKKHKKQSNEQARRQQSSIKHKQTRTQANKLKQAKIIW